MTSHRRLLGLLLAGSLLLYAFPLWWGLPGAGRGGKTWAFDEILSDNPGNSVRKRHGGRYPPLHYSVLRLVQSPVRALAERGAIDLDKQELRAWLQLLGRLLSVLMATTSVYWVYRSGRLLFERQAALFGAATWALVTPLAFFAKTVNLDVPYVFWFSLSVLFFLRIVTRHRLADYLAFAVSGALAITTKDQAYALYLLPALALVFDLAARLESKPSRIRRLARALVDRRLVLGLVAAVAVFAVVHDLASDMEGFRQHLRMIAGTGSDPGNAFPPTIVGHLAMAVLAIRHLGFSMTWPLFALAICGLVVAVKNRLEDRFLLMLLLFPISYYLTFISVIHYHRLRFFLPVCLVFSLLAARGWRYAFPPGARRGWAVPVLVVLLGWSLAQSLTLDLRMHFDSRYAAEAWIRQREAAGESVLVVGDYRQVMPRTQKALVPIARLLGPRGRLLRAADADYLVLNPTEFTSERARDFVENPQAAGMRYELDHRYGARSAWDLLDFQGLATNLSAVSPGLIVLRRVDLGLPIEEMQATARALLAGGTPDEWSELLLAIRESEGLMARDVGSRALGYGLGRHGTTQGDRPAALVVSSRRGAELVPRLLLRCVWELVDCPGAVEIATSRARYRVDLRRNGEPAQIDLHPIEPDSDLLVLLVGVPAGGLDGDGLGPVRVRVGVAPSEAEPEGLQSSSEPTATSPVSRADRIALRATE